MSRALVIDDEDAIRELVGFALESDGFAVETLPAATGASDVVARGKYDVIVLDANLPEIDGFTFIERVRAVSRVPILMLTVRHDEADIVRALDLGADDYVTKPFSPRELVARVRTVMHRHRADDGWTLEAGGVSTVVNLAAQTAKRSNESRTRNLTASEVLVLHLLLASRGHTVPRRALLRALGDSERPGASRTLDVHICRIRQKIEPIPERFSFIRTVRGIGYAWLEDPDELG